MKLKWSKILRILMIVMLLIPLFPMKDYAATIGDVSAFYVSSSTPSSIKLSWGTSTGATYFVLKEGNTVIYEGKNTTFEVKNLTANSAHTFYLYGTDGVAKSNLSYLKAYTLADTSLVGVDPYSSDYYVNFKCNNVSTASSDLGNFEIYLDGTYVGYDDYNSNLANNQTQGYDYATAYVYVANTSIAHTVNIQLTDTSNNMVCNKNFTLYPSLIAPKNLKVDYQMQGINALSWDALQGATNYILKDNGVTIYTGPKTTFVHTGLGSDTNHSYTVYATNGSTNGPATSSLNVVAKGKLSYTFDSMEDSSEIRFTCLNSAHATGYMELMQDGVMVDYDNYSTNKSNNGGEALFGVYGLQPGQKYFYTLSVYDSTNSYYICSEDIVISTAPATPNVSFYETVYDYGYAYFQASQSTQGATSYEVYRDGLLVYSGVSSSFYDDSIEFGIPYTYEYYAVSAGGRSQPLIKEVTYDMPIDTNYTSDSQNITLNWFDLGGTITSWSLYDADDNEYLYYDPSTQYTFTGLQPNTTYDYQVVGINEDEGIEYHYYTSATTTAAAPVPLTPANLRWTEKGDNYTKIAWDTSSGATGYVLKRDNVQIYSGAGTSFTDTGLTSGTTYTYTLYASNSSGNSGNTTLTTTAGSSINATVTPTSSSSMGISWTNTDASVVKYTVTQTTNNKILTSLTTSTSVSDAGLNPNTTYTYKIEGFDSGGIKRYETIKSNTTLTGSLDISAPSATFNFGSVTVDGSVKNLNANLDKLTISDTRGTNAGWNVTVSASQFTQTTGSTPLKLPVNTLKLNGISSITQTSGSSALPTSSSGSPWIIDNGAIKILSANTNAGAGTFDIVFPANALILSIDTGKKVIDPLNKPTVYTNSLTWIVSTGP